jgi:hypothetical protein
MILMDLANMRDRDDDGDGFATISETVVHWIQLQGKNIITNIIAAVDNVYTI